jgi:NDP-sugar pyrophosphorylase family protein
MKSKSTSRTAHSYHDPNSMTSTTSPTLLVLAAGLGSRYGGLKQLDPVGPSGEIIIDYSICDAIRAGFSKVVFVIRKDIEAAFRETVGARFSSRIVVDYAFQELDSLPLGFAPPPGRNRPWGTAHAVLVATDAIQSPFTVINADDFYGGHSFRLLAQHLSAGSPEYAMVAFPLRSTLSPFGTVSRGICELDSGGYLRAICERTCITSDGQHARNTDSDGHITHLTGDELVSMNIWGFTPAIFPELRAWFASFFTQHHNDLTAEAFLPSFVNDLITSGRASVRVLQTPDPWFGITYREDLPRVASSIRALIAAGRYPERLL